MEQEIIKDIDVQSVMTKSSLPVGGYSVNPYVGCPHACRYCYASFMKRFTGHAEPWGTFLDVKHWKPIGNPHKFDGQRIVIGSVTDGYNPYEEEFLRTRDAKTFCSSLDYHSIAQAIQDALPGFYGYYFMNHFLPYLQMPITTPEQEQAFHKIVEFWDHTTLRIPLLLRFSGWLNWRLSSKACLQKTLEQTEQRTQKYLNLTEEEYQDLKEQTLKNVKLRNHPLVKYHPFFIAHRRFMRKLQDCGYNDIFLPNMMALSPEYKAYHDALDKINQRICEDLGLYYDSNFQLVLKK